MAHRVFYCGAKLKQIKKADLSFKRDESVLKKEVLAVSLHFGYPEVLGQRFSYHPVQATLGKAGSGAVQAKNVSTYTRSFLN